jgi:uncharacterized protein (DUF433 family)
MEIAIIDRGRGPEIKGTRITVYDVLDYTRKGWHANSIALFFGLSTDQILAAIEYIQQHKDEVMSVYDELLKRDARGNPPEIEALLESSRGKARERAEELRRIREANGDGHSAGQ